jgi:hypothetical protein
MIVPMPADTRAHAASPLTDAIVLAHMRDILTDYGAV